MPGATTASRAAALRDLNPSSDHEDRAGREQRPLDETSCAAIVIPAGVAAGPRGNRLRLGSGAQLRHIINNMKTIAISIDEMTLKLLDELAAGSPKLGNRSALVRAAVREFAERVRRSEIETREDRILKKHRRRLARQAAALIAEQARP